MVLLDRLRRNDKSYTELVFYENDFWRSDNFLDLVTAILTNTVVDTVRFHDCANPKWSSKQIQLLFSAIARLPRLSVVSLARTAVTLESLAVVVDKGVHLKEVDIWDSYLVGNDRDVIQLAKVIRRSQMTSMFLKQVTFEGTSCLDPLFAACQDALDILMLEDVHWKPGAVSDDVFRLLQSSRLAQFGIQNLKLEESQYLALAEGLKRSSLRDLTFWNVEISDAVAAALSDALSMNDSLKRLCLYRCSLSDNGAIELAKMLRYNTSLNSLELSENKIGDQGAIALANALLTPTSAVRTFEISGNAIEEQGIGAILHLSERSSILETLKLYSLYRNNSSEEEAEIQRKINARMNLNVRTLEASRNPGKRPKVWYE